MSEICLTRAFPEMAKVFALRDAWTFGFWKWRTDPSSLNMLTSSIPGIGLMESFLSWLWSFLSSVDEALCTIFFFLRTVPLPPTRTDDCRAFSFSGFIFTADRSLLDNRNRTQKWDESP